MFIYTPVLMYSPPLCVILSESQLHTVRTHYLLSSYQVSWGPEIRAWAPSDTFAIHKSITKICTHVYTHRLRETCTQTQSCWIWSLLVEDRIKYTMISIAAPHSDFTLIAHKSLTLSKNGILWEFFPHWSGGLLVLALSAIQLFKIL